MSTPNRTSSLSSNIFTSTSSRSDVTSKKNGSSKIELKHSGKQQDIRYSINATKWHNWKAEQKFTFLLDSASRCQKHAEEELNTYLIKSQSEPDTKVCVAKEKLDKNSIGESTHSQSALPTSCSTSSTSSSSFPTSNSKEQDQKYFVDLYQNLRHAILAIKSSLPDLANQPSTLKP